MVGLPPTSDVNTLPQPHTAATIDTFRSSSVVEQPAVNRRVVGSNPTCGAKA